MNTMFAKQLDKINSLLNDAKQQSSINMDSIGLISNNISRPKTQSKKISFNKKPKYQQQIVLIKEGIPKKFQKILQDLFRAKCQNLSIQFNERNWQTFIKAFFLKNKIINQQITQQTLNLNDFYFGQNCIKQINNLLYQNPQLIKINLSKSYLNPNTLIRIQTFKQLSLCNCKLGNDILQQLFTRLLPSLIQKISLSSPQLKNRNQLTKYDKLINLIQASKTLHTLQLSNIQIHPNSMILQSSKNTNLKHINLSDNTNVKGICSSLLSLNLSRNNIIIPFIFPMSPNQLQYLNLSYNKIPYYHFKQFLKTTYFPNIKYLILDHILLDGDLSSIQYYLQQSLSIIHLSLIDCDLNQNSYINIIQGVRYSRSLQSIDLTRNRVINQKIAENISNMLQGCILKSIKMRHCDIKDRLGQIIFKNIRKNKTLQRIDMMNNLLGDNTAKTICFQLKYAKNIINLFLQQNIIKYKDMQEINSYLQGNKYFNIYQLDKEYHKLININKQIQQAHLIISSENQKLYKLEKQTEGLQYQYMIRFKNQNQDKKNQLKKNICLIKNQENQLMTDITLKQTYLSMTENMDISKQDSFLDFQSNNNLDQ